MAGFGDFSGNANETDMLMRNNNTGAFELYDISNNQITSAAPMGQVGLEWQVVGFGPINGAGASDMLMRNSNTGSFEIYDITNNGITSAAAMGQVGLEWSAAGIAADEGGSPNSQLVQAMASMLDPAGAHSTRRRNLVRSLLSQLLPQWSPRKCRTPVRPNTDRLRCVVPSDRVSS